MSRAPKRRRLEQGEEQVQTYDPQHPTTYSQSDFQLQSLPAATTQQHLNWTLYGNVQTVWNQYPTNATPVDNVIDYHMGSYNQQNTIGTEPSFPYQNGINIQWPSFSNVPLNSHLPLQTYVPIQTHLPMFEPSYQQYPLYGTPINQPIAGFQQWPQLIADYPSSQPLPYHSDLSQNTAICVESSSAVPDQNEGVGEIVCFGMIPSIVAKCDQRETAHSLLASFPVELEGSTRFSSKDRSDVSGQIPPEYSQMIQDLLDETCLELHVSCIIGGFQSADAMKSPHGPSTIPCSLEISVYGPLSIFEELGAWFEHYQVYLQDPRECHREVRYCNPHRLSTDDISTCSLLSDFISQSSSSLELVSTANQSDLLDELCSHENLEEAPQPSVIKQELKRHQKQALTFMLRREQGWAFSDHDPDIWEMKHTEQGTYFLNRVSDVPQFEEPPQCYGGIVADPMGLGKTLTMISLVATDLDNDDIDIGNGEEFHAAIPTTLIVVPPSLIGTWEEQLSEHVVQDGLTYYRYHRKGRQVSLHHLQANHIVLTTYHTISADWSSSNGINSVLFSVRWKRIILDEGKFTITNINAICALDSRSRWAVTGTPIQNRLGDLASLFKFIRVHPYTDRKCFDADISRLWKNGEYQEAIKRLKRLSKCLILRRDKGTISLPPREDLQCPVDFSPEEQALYDNLREDTLVSIDEAKIKDPDSLKPVGYVHVLQRIESLRLVCNIGLHYHTRHDKVIRNIQEADEWTRSAQDAFNMEREMVPIICLLCSSALDITETMSEDRATASQTPLFFSCLTYVCADCAQRSRNNVECGHNPRCAMARISMSGESLEMGLLDMQTQTNVSLPSKVKALITDIRNLPSHTKCVVFSTWRLTLDIIEAGLAQSSISSVRFDGKVPQKSRQNVVGKFRNDPSIRVMLLTLSCGAAGLTLTEATRAYLMEPHWNPTIEEQALARIHRIGQTQEVTTVRFFMRNSFEHRVIEMQESKKHLAGLLLSPDDDDGYGSENLGRLQELSSLV
ncbi:hypothetical protein FPOAC1_007403 [Fusarium poae]|uniref:hypothetical protein n=1 Tax=Fusarium poae TaxID=36050 RepID=UPI001CEBC3B8|nr:hypothetical protein FPOAC1_007403 [Fusarium poae]KAG8668042.1 hypothetical protein FPOAC1_007403 [Fusarium poae]